MLPFRERKKRNKYKKTKGYTSRRYFQSIGLHGDTESMKPSPISIRTIEDTEIFVHHPEIVFKQSTGDQCTGNDA
jgi:hypothetical protein